ncbi:MAG: helix-turn-helix domain-containing protein [Trueperaceae bacterium]|nr:helix-turn-helix domain-containing protein [Trueperaceae bacterium]
MQKPHEPPLLTAEAVSRLLGVDPTTVYRMASDGRLPALKVGRQWRFTVEQLQDVLARGIRASAADAPPAAATRAGERAAWSDLDVVADVADLVAETLGVTMVVADLAGRPLTPILRPCPRLAALNDDPGLRDLCSAEWGALAADLDFEPRFHTGALGFQCARALVRRGDRLIGMVLAGGVAPAGTPDDGLHHLDDEGRARVLRVLPRFAATLSRLAAPGDGAPTHDAPTQGGTV